MPPKHSAAGRATHGGSGKNHNTKNGNSTAGSGPAAGSGSGSLRERSLSPPLKSSSDDVDAAAASSSLQHQHHQHHQQTQQTQPTQLHHQQHTQHHQHHHQQQTTRRPRALTLATESPGSSMPYSLSSSLFSGSLGGGATGPLSPHRAPGSSLMSGPASAGLIAPPSPRTPLTPAGTVGGGGGGSTSLGFMLGFPHPPTSGSNGAGGSVGLGGSGTPNTNSATSSLSLGLAAAAAASMTPPPQSPHAAAASAAVRSRTVSLTVHTDAASAASSAGLWGSPRTPGGGILGGPSSSLAYPIPGTSPGPVGGLSASFGSLGSMSTSAPSTNHLDVFGLKSPRTPVSGFAAGALGLSLSGASHMQSSSSGLLDDPRAAVRSRTLSTSGRLSEFGMAVGASGSVGGGGGMSPRAPSAMTPPLGAHLGSADYFGSSPGSMAAATRAAREARTRRATTGGTSSDVQQRRASIVDLDGGRRMPHHDRTALSHAPAPEESNADDLLGTFTFLGIDDEQHDPSASASAAPSRDRTPAPGNAGASGGATSSSSGDDASASGDANGAVPIPTGTSAGATRAPRPANLRITPTSALGRHYPMSATLPGSPGRITLTTPLTAIPAGFDSLGLQTPRSPSAAAAALMSVATGPRTRSVSLLSTTQDWANMAAAGGGTEWTAVDGDAALSPAPAVGGGIPLKSPRTGLFTADVTGTMPSPSAGALRWSGFTSEQPQQPQQQQQPDDAAMYYVGAFVAGMAPQSHHGGSMHDGHRDTHAMPPPRIPGLPAIINLTDPNLTAAGLPHPTIHGYPQNPTRSLWIGNLNVARVSSDDLHAVFSPFGAIESLRVLPDKDCAFVNYLTVEEAVAARAAMQGWNMGGQPIKIGFGKVAKAEQFGAGSTPGMGYFGGGAYHGAYRAYDHAAMAAAAAYHHAQATGYHLSVTGASGAPAVDAVAPNDAGDADEADATAASGASDTRTPPPRATSSRSRDGLRSATPSKQQQQQGSTAASSANAAAAAAATAVPEHANDNNVPTRALWIGNLPPSFTVQQLSSMFSPFGAIESCRILTHKNCGFVNYTSEAHAVAARRAMHARDIGGYFVRIGYARVPTSPPKQPSGVDVNTTLLTNVNGTLVAGISPYVEQTGGAAPTSTEEHATQNAHATTAAPTATAAASTPMSAATQGIVMALMTMATAMSDPNSAAMFGMLPPHVLMAPPEVTGVVDMSANPLEWPTLPAPKGDGTNGTAVLDAKAAAAEFAAAQAHLASTHEAHEVRRPMDPTTVRELRRKLDFAVTPSDVSAVFILALPRAEDLALDYAGNTVLQKLIERASPAELGMLAQVLTPGLPEVSVHKHGTWVVQKLMDGLFSAVAHTLAGAGSADATGPNNEGGVADPAHLPSSATRELLVALAEYAPALLCDPYGNYVVQNALKLPSATGYVFASVLPHLVSVAQSRFGARALRGCLESQFTTAAQRRRIAVALLDHAEELATHSHGILLLTWVAEHSGFPGCRAALVAAIAPHLAVLATSKVAFPLIFRLASQASEPNARDAIVRHLFLQPPTSSAASGPRSRSSSPAPSSSSATSSVSASNKKARKGGRKASKDRTESTAATNVESPKKPILDQVLADVAVGLPLIHRILGQCILDPALRAECAVQVVRSLSRSAPDLAATAATGAPSSMATTAAAPAGGAHGSGFPPYAMPMMMPPMWPGFHQYYGGGGGGGGAGGQLPPQPYMPFPPMMMYPQPMPHFMPQLGFGGFPPTGSAGGFAAPHMPQQHQQQLVSFEGDGPAVATDDRNGAAEQ